MAVKDHKPRTCIRCQKLFNSSSIANRICPICTTRNRVLSKMELVQQKR